MIFRAFKGSMKKVGLLLDGEMMRNVERSGGGGYNLRTKDGRKLGVGLQTGTVAD